MIHFLEENKCFFQELALDYKEGGVLIVLLALHNNDLQLVLVTFFLLAKLFSGLQHTQEIHPTSYPKRVKQLYSSLGKENV